jgi:hypothetical protein
VKLPAKIACLLLALTVLLNSAGFAAMLNCDPACCQSVPASASSNHMGCHEEDEMARSESEPAVQLTALPPNSLPQNVGQCSGTATSSMLTGKQEFSHELIASTTPEPRTSSTTQNGDRERVLRLLPSGSFSSIVPPLRI